MNRLGLLIVLSGPSGAGKGTIGAHIKRHIPNVRDSISVTTRDPRPGEQEGVHYYFRTQEEYQHMIARGEFLETASVYCNYYGTPKKPVLDMLTKGYDVLFDIDTLGAKQIKKAYPDAVTIFIMPPSMAELKKRLIERKTESEEALKRRLDAAKKELAEYAAYDYFVVNDDIDVASDTVVSIIKAEKTKTARNQDIIKQMLGE